MLNKNLFASTIFFCIGITAMAQGATPPPPTPPPPPGLPIDGGLIFLAVIAFAYGICRSVKLTNLKSS
ncbi:MAG: hypothetical protein HKN40_02970 [Winogradskyella sp.]|uniref:hypothetical protein n=1 Tax=Winogradskyella sp. TaxID=1883156 RepID=UPI00181B1F79|nr:hypothetical protein [Winogradskyella sp.]